ncbi:hypothetical protein JVU11DRAFT_11546 [Chiua virens]|nr:hypothetical protein JVU11DRAFT_11546 [Chiua virens]
MPSVAVLQTGDKLQSNDLDVVDENKPEKIKLWLPSELLTGTACDPRLRQIE